MNEINKNTLSKCISALPDYQPPEPVWEGISATLDRLEAEGPLRVALRDLPRYEPPELTWESISAELEPEKVEAPTFRLIPKIAWATAAAALLALVIFNWPQANQQAQISYVVEEKAAVTSDLENDWDADEDLIQQLIAQFEESPKANHSSDYHRLKEEWTELSSAKDDLQVMIEKYGQDTDIIEQLKEIEIERSAVVKKMAALI